MCNICSGKKELVSLLGAGLWGLPVRNSSFMNVGKSVDIYNCVLVSKSLSLFL